jgi:selT/selW/selH-like putative selenoprotein
LAAKIRQSLGVESRLVAEGRGIFDVVVDGNLVYSKFETGAFPDNDQLVNLLLAGHGEQRK